MIHFPEAAFRVAVEVCEVCWSFMSLVTPYGGIRAYSGPRAAVFSFLSLCIVVLGLRGPLRLLVIAHILALEGKLYSLLILSNSQLTGNIPKFTKNIIINVSGNLGFKLIKEDGVLSRKCHQRSKLALVVTFVAVGFISLVAVIIIVIMSKPFRCFKEVNSMQVDHDERSTELPEAIRGNPLRQTLYTCSCSSSRECFVPDNVMKLLQISHVFRPAVNEGRELAKWVQSHSSQQEQPNNILDLRVSKTSTVATKQMLSALSIAHACINISPGERPKMNTVLRTLTRI
ncbi:hypothetical protein Bca52824_081244 [Brassica carinata]|uniref:LRR receptor-like serine/threonine-protein kinase n=1 Tax=Brassica carinata TaxID=52824 RepID=A0A8X7PIC5_BRACI|nr:hypothetical protein Bca52824_081244 [Brassica carinata]